MRFSAFGLAFAVACSVFTGVAHAQPMQTPEQKGLSAPVIALTPVLMRSVDALKLDDKQKEELKVWVSTKPQIRAALEDEVAADRAKLRAMIAGNAPRAEREALAKTIGANETRLIMMRSDCVDHWRAALSQDQFAQLLKLAGVTN